MNQLDASILQPANSAEINSQNFIVSFDSGEQVVLRRCCKFYGKERYEALNRMLNLLKSAGPRGRHRMHVSLLLTLISWFCASNQRGLLANALAPSRESARFL